MILIPLGDAGVVGRAAILNEQCLERVEEGKAKARDSRCLLFEVLWRPGLAVVVHLGPCCCGWETRPANKRVAEPAESDPKSQQAARIARGERSKRRGASGGFATVMPISSTVEGCSRSLMVAGVPLRPQAPDNRDLADEADETSFWRNGKRSRNNSASGWQYRYD